MEKVSLLDLKPILLSKPAAPKAKEGEGPAFSDIIKDSIQKVDQAQKDADRIMQDFVTKKNTDLHEVMITWEKADISLKLFMKIRNKVLDAYQEVMRMQV